MGMVKKCSSLRRCCAKKHTARYERTELAARKKAENNVTYLVRLTSRKRRNVRTCARRGIFSFRTTSMTVDQKARVIIENYLNGNRTDAKSMYLSYAKNQFATFVLIAHSELSQGDFDRMFSFFSL